MLVFAPNNDSQTCWDEGIINTTEQKDIGTSLLKPPTRKLLVGVSEEVVIEFKHISVLRPANHTAPHQHIYFPNLLCPGAKRDVNHFRIFREKACLSLHLERGTKRG